MQYIEKIKDKDYFVTEINASKFKGYKNLIEEFGIAFSIPSTPLLLFSFGLPLQ